MDQVTPLYKARVEELRSDLQRAVFDAIALHWDPITTHDLAQATGVGVTGLSSQLARLREFGLIEEVPTSGARAGYQLGERFFNIWYLMRHGTRLTRQRMRWLTGFLETFYSSDELLSLRERMTPRWDHGDWGLLYAAALDAAIERSLRQSRYRSATDAAASRISSAPENAADPGRLAVQEAYAAAHLATEEGRFEDAEIGFREAIRLNSGNPWAWDSLGDLLADSLGRYAEAEESYRTAIRLDPSLVWPWYNLGRLLTGHLGRHAEAEEAYRAALRLDPNNALACVTLGDVLADHLGRHDEAEEAYREAIRLDPENTWSWFGLGRLLTLHLGQHRAAEEAYRTAIRFDPDNGLAWDYLGDVLADHLGRHEEAEEAYRAAIRVSPEAAWPWFDLGCLLAHRLGKYAEAEEAFSMAIQLEPRNDVAWCELGDVLTRQLARHAEAEEAYRSAIRLDPECVTAWGNLGVVLTHHLDRHAEAENAFRTVVQIDSQDALGWFYLGNVLADHLGRPAEAGEAYRKSIDLYADHDCPRFGLVSVYAEVGRVDEARHAKQAITSSDPVGLALLDATIELAQDNFGRAAALLGDALTGDLGGPNWLRSDILYRLLQFAERRGYGERLIQWFTDSGHAYRYAPIHTAFVALVRGASTLLDVNPEVRAPAERVLARLAGQRPPLAAEGPPRPHRGRRRRRLGG